MIKFTAYLLAFAIGFMLIEPAVASTYAAFTIEQSFCCSNDEESCCSAETEAETDCEDQEDTEGCCNKDACCNYGSCYCCCICKTQDPYLFKTYFISNNINSISEPIGISDFNSTCFQPPEVV